MSQNVTFVFGCEPLIAPFEDSTIREAWKKYAADLGADPGRTVTFRKGGQLISGDARLEEGASYQVTVAHEQKGAAFKGRSKASQKRRAERDRLATLKRLGVKVTRAA